MSEPPKKTLVSFPPEIITAIDKRRGPMPRSTWIVQACRSQLDRPEDPTGERVPASKPPRRPAGPAKSRARSTDVATNFKAGTVSR